MKVSLYILTFILLAIQIHKINPSLVNLNENIIVDIQKLNPGIARPFNISKHPELKEASFTYRGSVRRTGVSSESLVLPLFKEKSIEKMNYGIHGASKSSVSVDEWGIVVPTDSSWIYHFDHDHNLQWKFFVSESLRGIHGTALLTENVVYFGAYNGRFYALNRKTGQPIWVYKLGGAIGASPVLWEGNIYIAIERVDVVDGYLVKLDAKTGKLQWKSKDIGEQAHSSPAIDPELGLVYFGANNEKFFSFKESDGSLKWEYTTNGPVKGTPAVGGQCVLFTDWSGLLYCIRGASGAIKWSVSIEEKSQSSPTLIEEIDRVIVSSNKGHIFGINYSTGNVVWKKEVDSPIMMGSATAYMNKELNRWQVVTTCGEKKVCIYDAADGKLHQEIVTQGLITSVPTIYNYKLYLSTHDGDVEIFKSK